MCGFQVPSPNSRPPNAEALIHTSIDPHIHLTNPVPTSPDLRLRDGLVERALDSVREWASAQQVSPSAPALASPMGATLTSSTFPTPQPAAAAARKSGQDPATLIQCLARW